MNKQTIITALLALVAMSGQGQTFNWKIEGTVSNANPEETLSLIDIEEQKEVTTLQVRDGRITLMNMGSKNVASNEIFDIFTMQYSEIFDKYAH